jgi:hypothetical protein
MADERAFNVYFANRGALPGEVPVDGDEQLILRGGTVYRAGAAAAYANAAMNANAVATTITTVNVWEVIGGVLVQGLTSPTFTFAANEFTYIGINHIAPASIRASMSIIAAAVVAGLAYEVGVFVNGIQVGPSMSVNATSTEVGFVLIEAAHALQTNDVIDMRVRNIKDDTDATLIDAQLIIG